jgi:hypothetical protein
MPKYSILFDFFKMKPMMMIIWLLVITMVSGDRLKHLSNDHVALRRHQSMVDQAYQGGQPSSVWRAVGKVTAVATLIAVVIRAYQAVRSILPGQKRTV